MNVLCKVVIIREEKIIILDIIKKYFINNFILKNYEIQRRK